MMKSGDKFIHNVIGGITSGGGFKSGDYTYKPLFVKLYFAENDFRLRFAGWKFFLTLSQTRSLIFNLHKIRVV